MENESFIIIPIAAVRPGTTDTEGLEVILENVPEGSNFSRGRQEGDRWIFMPQDFGEVQLELPPGYSGMLNLQITAVANGASRQRSLLINVHSTIDTVTEGTQTAEMPTSSGDTPTRETTSSGVTITRETPTDFELTSATEIPTGSGEAETTDSEVSLALTREISTGTAEMSTTATPNDPRETTASEVTLKETSTDSGSIPTIETYTATSMGTDETSGGDTEGTQSAKPNTEDEGKS